MGENRRDDVLRDGRLWLGLATMVFLPPLLAASTVGSLVLYPYEFATAKIPLRAGFPVPALSAAVASLAAAAGVCVARLPALWSVVAAFVGFAAYVGLTVAGFLVWSERL